MNNNSFFDLIKKSLLNYDIKNEKYKMLKKEKYVVSKDTSTIDFINLKKKFQFNILGVFSYSSKVWIWSWLIPYISYNLSESAKKLLDYGIKLNPGELDFNKLWIKSQLVNSRFLLQDRLQLEIHLAMAFYLLKDNYDCVYEIKETLSNDKDDYLIYYYILKEI